MKITDAALGELLQQRSSDLSDGGNNNGQIRSGVRSQMTAENWANQCPDVAAAMNADYPLHLKGLQEED